MWPFVCLLLSLSIIFSRFMSQHQSVFHSFLLLNSIAFMNIYIYIYIYIHTFCLFNIHQLMDTWAVSTF